MTKVNLQLLNPQKKTQLPGIGKKPKPRRKMFSNNFSRWRKPQSPKFMQRKKVMSPTVTSRVKSFSPKRRNRGRNIPKTQRGKFNPSNLHYRTDNSDPGCEGRE